MASTTLTALPADVIPNIHKETFQYLARRLLVRRYALDLNKTSELNCNWLVDSYGTWSQKNLLWIHKPIWSRRQISRQCSPWLPLLARRWNLCRVKTGQLMIDFFKKLIIHMKCCIKVIHFLLSPDQFERFLDPNYRAQRYSKLRSQNLVILLEKWDFLNRKWFWQTTTHGLLDRFRDDTSYFSRTSAEDKQRTKNIDNFIKLLKAQSSSFNKA